MLSTFLGVHGVEAASFRDRVRSLRAEVVVAEPELVVLAAPGAVASHVDDDIVCVVWGPPDLVHLPSSPPGAAASRIASAYGRGGEAAVSLLRPPFALLLWRRSLRTGLIATDQLGARSVFTAELQGRLLFSGEVVDLLAALPTRPAPDFAMLASWLAGRGVPSDRTLYAGIDRLSSGHLLTLGGERRSVRRYAVQPGAAPLHGEPAEIAQRVRAAVQHAVEARLPVDATVGVLLSGGIDSSSVAAAAVRARGSERIIAVSAVFPDRLEADESALISAVTQKLFLRGKHVAVDVRPILGDTVEFQTRWQLPAESPTLGFQLALQRLATDAGATVVIDGEGGDELFGLRPYLIADAVRRSRLIEAWRLAYSLGGGDPRVARSALLGFGLKGAAPPWAHRLLRRSRRPSWLREDVDVDLPAETMGYAWKSLGGQRWYAEGRDQLTRGRERMGVHDYLRRREAMAGSVGAHPFMQDLDLVELALRLPPEHSFASAHDRSVLREAMRGELPDVVRLRTGKSYFNHLVDDALNGPDREALEALLSPGAEISAIVRSSFLDDLRAAPLDKRRGLWSWTAWRFAAAESWLGLQSDPDFRERAAGSRGG